MSSKKIALLLSLIFLLITGYFYKLQALSFRFVDEEDNFTFGKYLSRGEKLYDDLITNHQPLTHIYSSLVHKLAQPNTTYLLLVRHREAVILYSLVWSLILVYYFGFRALIFVVIYELTKIQLLGNLFLAESLAVYPLTFLSGFTFFRQPKFKFELFFWGVSFGLSLFLLAPIWPALLLLLLIHIRQVQRELKYTLAGFLIPLILVLIHSSISGYLYYFYVNLTFTIPGYQHDPIWLSTLKGIFSPILAFEDLPQTPTLWITRICSVILSAVVLMSLRAAKGRGSLFLLWLFLGFLNVRFVLPGTEGYSGFHLLPWYGSLIFLVCLLPMKGSFGLIRLWQMILLSLAILLSMHFSLTSLFKKTDQLLSYNINYSTYTTIGEAVRIMKGEGDSLFVSSNAWLVYWQSDTNHLPKLYVDYIWASGFPPLREKIMQTLENSPPAFLYCENCRGLPIEKYLSKYQEVKLSGNPTKLYLLPEKLTQLSGQQIGQLKFRNISF